MNVTSSKNIALLSGPSRDWVSMVSGLWLCLMDDGSANDVNFPFLSGQTIAYGRPSLGTLNTYRGAYNSANQVLAQMDATKARWKFQYDFTTAQANSGTIRSVGLTNQFVGQASLKNTRWLKGLRRVGSSPRAQATGQATVGIDIRLQLRE